jgi:DNA-binding beta-propeller fold protein YncE
VDSSGNLYVADSHNDTIRVLTPIGTNWLASTIAGSLGMADSADSTNVPLAQFSAPDGLAVDVSQTIYATEGSSRSIRIWDNFPLDYGSYIFGYVFRYWRVVRSCRFLQSEDSGVTAADKADFGGEEFLERKAFG